MLYKDPCVYVVGDEYQIVMNTLEFGIAWVEVGGKAYRDSVGGLMRSETLVHRVSVPMAELDAAKSYRVCFRALPERKPYFPELGPLQAKEYAFRPVTDARPLNISMLADTHSMVDAPVRAAGYFGDRLDLLIMNGDIPTASQTHEDIRSIFDITSAVTHGEIPVVFARGNHDYRGRLALEMPQYIGSRNGDTWFTFRVGSLWGVVLDCGEDKDDSHPEYGGLVDCHDLRLRQTAFLRDVIARAESEYLAPGVKTRIAVSHVPFCAGCMEDEAPIFNIERPVYTEWTELLNQMGLDVMLCGHMHFFRMALPGTDGVRFGARFPVVIASEVYYGRVKECPRPEHHGACYIGLAMTVGEEETTFTAVSDLGTEEPLLTLPAKKS